MTYSDLIEEEAIKAQYLIVMKPARTANGFALVSGSTYKISFTHGQVVEAEQNGVALTLASSSTLASGEFFYDVTAEELFVRMSDDSNPSTKIVIATYEIYVGTFDGHFHRVPTDSSTRQVYYDPLVRKESKIQERQTDNGLGFLETKATELTLINDEHTLEKHISDSSFHERDIDIYHHISEHGSTGITIVNIKKILSAKMDNPSYTESEVKIKIFEKADIFSKEWRNPDTSFYTTSDFSGLDPNFKNRAIRYIYGRKAGVKPVNLDYEADAPTTSNNRIWGVRADKTKTHAVTRTIGTGSTTTNIVLSDTSGLFIGDGIYIDKATDEPAQIISIVTNTSITLKTALASGAPVNNDTLSRPTISRVSIIQEGKRFDALPTRDFTVTSLAADVLGFTFTSSLESNLSMPSTLSPSDEIFCVVYGPKNTVTLGGPAFGGDSTTTGNLTAPAPILVDILKTHLGLTEADLNTASFTAFQAATTEDISLAIPFEQHQDFPTFKDILKQMNQTLLTRIFFDDSQTLRILKIAPLAVVDKTTSNEEIGKRVIQYGFDYNDIVSDIRVEYDRTERSDRVNALQSSALIVASVSNTAKFLHKVSRQKTFKSFHLLSSDAQTLSDRLSFMHGDRRGIMSLRLKNRFFDTEISDNIKVQREKLPGFEFVSGTLRSKEFSVVEFSKDLREIVIRLDDQQGIQDNEGSW